jgi:ADP-heptose:LPS heptosyltransferase
MNIQPQSGIGDLINLLPYIEKLYPDITIATNHTYALEPFKNIKTVPVEYNGILPIIRKDFQHLKYTRYSEKRYCDIYFQGNDYELYVKKVRERYKNYYNSKLQISGKYTVFAPPHAAKRHQHKKFMFECTPDVKKTYYFIFSLKGKVILVGKDDIYPDLPDTQNIIDLRNKTSFTELCLLIKNADMVISQIGAITSLAGLFGISTKFLQAEKETIEEHISHVNGVIWPGQNYK